MIDLETFDYKSAVDKLLLVGRILPELQLEEIIQTTSRAHTIGPFVEPTKYRDALQRGDMDRICKLAQALQEPARIMEEMLKEYQPS